ncbi:MAG: radical SAM protein, partial [Bacteroidota bacterium]
DLTANEQLMTTTELLDIVSIFVQHGVNKIRLTGGEPLIRKDFPQMLESLSSMPVSLSITTNGVILDRFFDAFRTAGLKDVNVSLDTLQSSKFFELTRRNQFEKVYQNILNCIDEGFNTGINVVLLKDRTEEELLPFVELTKSLKARVKFIEFMPFAGNRWDLSKILTGPHALSVIKEAYGAKVVKMEDHPNSTSSNYRIKGYTGSFGLINTVTNPFCQGCNRLRLTADGSLKNCLFSQSETPLLPAYRAGKDITPLIAASVGRKKKVRAGMKTLEEFSTSENIERNRSMITIGG